MVYVIRVYKSDYAAIESGNVKIMARLFGEGNEKYSAEGMIREGDVLLITDLAESEMLCAKVTGCTPVYATLEELLNATPALEEYGLSDCPVKQAAEEIRKKNFYLEREIREGVYGIRFECC